MFRTSDIILIAVMLSAAAFTYKTKHDAEAVRSDIRRLEAQIQLEKDAIDILKADWSLFTQPGRLAALAEAYRDELGLEALDPKQIAQTEALRQIPFRSEAMVAEQGAEGGDAPDPTVTGGVRP
ncbi:cell division protein FtsL [Nitratireductor sp. GCM10026969]|uniref:cell division protein FtsL n=1 Tax=Nitratireductor sp. GCM10026969 TaxID=3252645 RepID=UPI003614C00F